MRLLAALAVAALLPFAAGCGVGEGPGAPDLVPGDVAFYLVVDTDFDGDQWQAVGDLAAKFPGGENAVEQLFDELMADTGAELDFEQDVKPALGPEVLVVGLEFNDGEEMPVVGLTQPDDVEAFQRLLAKSDDPPVTQEVDGWQAVAADQETLDRFLEARNGPRLSDSDAFEQATEDLGGDALVLAYVDGETLAAGALEGDAFVPPALDALADTPTPTASAFVLRAEDDAARIEGAMVFAEGSDPWFLTEPYEAELPEAIPADTLAYLSFSGLDRAISGLRDMLAESDPDAESQIGQLEAFLGVSLEGDIGPLLAGEGALYVRRGAVIPEVTLLMRVEDEAQALATLDRLVENAGVYLPLGEAQRSDVAGVEVRSLALAEPFGLNYAAFDGLLVLTTSTEGIVALRSDEERLADDDDFEDALDEAGVSGETTGFGWVNLEDALPLVAGLAELGGEEVGEIRGYTEPLRDLVFWGTEDGDIVRFSAYLGVD
jgi:hypothetical protein